MTRFLTWNVNGIRAVMKKGFEQIIDFLDVDVLCIQETKAQPDQIELSEDLFPYQYANSAKKKGYSGTLIASREKPLSVTYGIGIEEHDQEGRVVTCEFEDFMLVDVYTPNAGEGCKRLTYRTEWDKAFAEYIAGLPKPVLLCGDLNAVSEDIDLYDASAPDVQGAGNTPEERNGLHALMQKADLVDVFRTLHPDEVKFSWWPYMSRGRERNAGWRIDYWLASPALMNRIEDIDILNDVYGSDHCPVLLEADLKI